MWSRYLGAKSICHVNSACGGKAGVPLTGAPVGWNREANGKPHIVTDVAPSCTIGVGGTAFRPHFCYFDSSASTLLSRS